jgi:hypothetical protein
MPTIGLADMLPKRSRYKDSLHFADVHFIAVAMPQQRTAVCGEVDGACGHGWARRVSCHQPAKKWRATPDSCVRGYASETRCIRIGWCSVSIGAGGQMRLTDAIWRKFLVPMSALLTTCCGVQSRHARDGSGVRRPLRVYNCETFVDSVVAVSISPRGTLLSKR